MSKKKQDNFFTRLGGWLLGQFARRPKPVWILVTADVLLIALSLVVFALFHHVLPRNEKSVGLVSSRDSVSATPVPDDDEYIDDDAPDDDAPAAILAGDLFAGLRTGDFSNKFSGKFTGGDVVRSGADYQSANINVSISQHEAGEAVYYVADIYVRDISYFVTASPTTSSPRACASARRTSAPAWAASSPSTATTTARAPTASSSATASCSAPTPIRRATCACSTGTA